MRTVCGRGLAFAVVIVALAACAPPPPPAGPTWNAVRFARTAAPSVNYLGAWTDDEWFATVRATSDSGSYSADILFFPRGGPGNGVLGPPQSLPIGAPDFIGPIGEHVVGVSGAGEVVFFEETAGTWATAGTFTLGSGKQLIAMTDDWMVIRVVPQYPPTGADGSVEMYALDTTGATVVATFAGTLGPDPAWPAELRAGFGLTASLDGDLLAVSGYGAFAPAPGGVRVFRPAAGTWTPVLSLGGTTGTPTGFGRSIGVDDGASTDRLAVLTGATPSTVQVSEDTGSGFSPEALLAPDPGLPDTSNGLAFGNSLAIDGDLLALFGRQATVASAEAGHAPVTVGYVQLYRRGTSWTREAEVGTFVEPYDPDVGSANPSRLQVSGPHVAVSVLVNPDPPPGCVFPCFTFGFESWSIDRY